MEIRKFNFEGNLGISYCCEYSGCSENATHLILNNGLSIGEFISNSEQRDHTLDLWHPFCCNHAREFAKVNNYTGRIPR